MLVNSKCKRSIARSLRFEVAKLLTGKAKFDDLPSTPLTPWVARGLARLTDERKAALAEFAGEHLTPEIVGRAVDLVARDAGRRNAVRQIANNALVDVQLPNDGVMTIDSRKIARKLAELVRRTMAR